MNTAGKPRVFAVVPAAGSGRRMGADVPKQYLALAGRTVIEHTLARIAGHAAVVRVAIAVAAGDARFAACAAALGVFWLGLSEPSSVGLVLPSFASAWLLARVITHYLAQDRLRHTIAVGLGVVHLVHVSSSVARPGAAGRTTVSPSTSTTRSGVPNTDESSGPSSTSPTGPSAATRPPSISTSRSA